LSNFVTISTTLTQTRSNCSTVWLYNGDFQVESLGLGIIQYTKRQCPKTDNLHQPSISIKVLNVVKTSKRQCPQYLNIIHVLHILLNFPISLIFPITPIRQVVGPSNYLVACSPDVSLFQPHRALQIFNCANKYLTIKYLFTLYINQGFPSKQLERDLIIIVYLI
jgi:hypothetical protein